MHTQKDQVFHNSQMHSYYLKKKKKYVNCKINQNFVMGEKRYLGVVSLLLLTDSRSVIVTHVCLDCCDGVRNWGLLLPWAGATSKLASVVGIELLVSYNSGRGSRTSETWKTARENFVVFLMKCNTILYSTLLVMLWKTVVFLYKVIFISCSYVTS